MAPQAMSNPTKAMRRGAWLLFAVLVAGFVAPAATATVIDDFSADDKPILNSGESFITAGNSIGGSLNLTLDRVTGADDQVFGVDTEGLFLEMPEPEGVMEPTRALAVASWDGNNDPRMLDPVGLGGVDLSADTAFKLTVEEAVDGLELVLRVFTDGANSSLALLTLPDVAATTDFLIPYSALITENGTGADLSDVGAISLSLRAGTPQLTVISLFETASPAIEVTMVDLFTNDADIGATPVNPGDQIKYRITVTNSGGDALGLSVDVDAGVDANTAVSSVQTQPIAANDTYVTIGNVALDVAVGEGALANDLDADGDTPQVDIGSSDAVSTGGGTIAWNDVGGGLGDGAFTYSPAPGFRGIDTFDYTAVDDDGRSDTGTVQVLIESMVWFLDNTHAGADLGTLDDPFQSITAANLSGPGGGGDQDLPGDIIFFFTGSGTYAGGLELEDNQLVLGPEDGLVVDGVEVVADNDDARPTITAAAGNGFTLAMDNEIRAIDIGNTPSGVGLVGNDFGSVTVSNVEISGSGGAADLQNGTAAVVLENVQSTSGSLGIDLDAVGGSFEVTGSTTIDGTVGIALAVNNSAGASTFDFGATSIGQGSSPGVGAVLLDNATSTFDFASLDVDANGTAFSAVNAGTVRVGGVANTLDAFIGIGLQVESTAFNGAFASVIADSNGNAFPGIRLVSMSDADMSPPAVQIATVDIDDTTGSGIAISSSTGEVVIQGGTIGAEAEVGDGSNPAIAIAGGAAAITIAAEVSNNATGRSVEVTGRGGGTVSLRGAIDDDGTGIRLDSNSGGTIEFRGGMALDTGSLTAFTATGGGTVNICATDDCAAGTPVVNTIGAATALSTTAVNIAGTDIGAAGATFRSISVDQGGSSPDSPAIILDTTGSGTFSVTGTASTAGSGGTIENILDSDGIRLSSTGGRVTLRNMIIEDIGDADDAADPFATRSQVDGIHGEDVMGGLTVRGTTMRRFSDNAILGADFADSLMPTVWNGLEIVESTIQDSNRFHVGPEDPTGVADDSAEGMVRILGLSGTVLIDNSTFERGAQLIDVLSASSGTLTMTVQRSNFLRTIKEFRCMPPGTVNIGKAGLSVRVDGSAELDLFVGDPAESDPGLGNTFVDNATASIIVLHDDNMASGEIDTIISRNTFRVLDHLTGPATCPGGSLQFNTAQGGVFLGPGAGGFEGIVSNNLFDQVQAASGGTGQLTVSMDDGGDTELIVRGNTFQLPWDGSVRLVADGNNSAAILFGGPGAGQANTYVDGTVGSASDDVGFATPSPFNPWIVNVRNGGSLDLKIDSEILPQHDDVSSAFDESIDASINASGGTMNLHVTDSVSPDGYRLEVNAGTLNLFNEENVAGCPISAAQILDDNGNTGGMNSDATDPPFVSIFGTVNCTTTPPAAPNLTIP